MSDIKEIEILKVGSNIRIAREDAEAWRLSLPKTNTEKL